MADLPITPVPPALPPCHLHIAHREVQPGWCLIELDGEVDLSTAPDLEAALVELRVSAGFERFLLDFSGVGHLDSSGLRVLTAFRSRLGSDGELKLTGLQATVLHVLTLTGLDSMFDLWPTASSLSRQLNDSASPVPRRALPGAHQTSGNPVPPGSPPGPGGQKDLAARTISFP